MTTVALVGCGRWGRLILRDLVSLGADVTVVAPTETTRARALEAGASSAIADASQLGEAPDGFIVATPTAQHADSIRSLLRYERPIFVEKPMTNDVATARRLVEVAGDRIFVMDKWRYHPGVEALRDLAQAGDLGEVVAIRSERLGWGSPHRDVDPVWILLPHDLSIAFEILGMLPPAKSAYGCVPGHAAQDLTALLGSDGGAPRVVAEISATSPINRRSVRVVGTKGVAVLDDSYADHIVLGVSALGEGSSEPGRIPIAATMPLKSELAAFLGHLRGGPPPRSSAAEGLLIVERIAALRSLAGLPE